MVRAILKTLYQLNATWGDAVNAKLKGSPGKHRGVRHELRGGLLEMLLEFLRCSNIFKIFRTQQADKVSKALHTTQKPPSHIPSHWQISHVVHDVVIYIIIHPYILAILKYFLSERLKAPVVTTHQKSYRVRGKRRGVFLNPRRGDQAHDG